MLNFRTFSSLNNRRILIAIFVVAVILRIWSLGTSDMIDDEIYYTFRSIGYIDYVGLSEQTTPLYWFDPLPTWAKLSFHDHPPLVFLIQHIFLSVLGPTVIAARIPFVLAGLISVWLVYLITKKLFDETTGLVAATLMAVTPLAVWISRVALMEGIVVMFMLLAWYLFLRALEEPRCWYWWGAAVGLSLLAKYTAFPLLAVFLLYLLIFNRQVFKDFRLYLGLLIVAAVFSPVLIYNTMLFQAKGHFDLQFAALFGQQAAEWQTLGLKTEGSPIERIAAIGPELLNAFSPLFVTLLLISLVYAVFRIIKERSSQYLLAALLVCAYVVFLVVIKPLPRFIATIEPFAVVLVAAAATTAWQQRSGLKKYLVAGGISLFILSELSLTINTHLTKVSWGWPNITFSMVRPFSADFGINALDRYFSNELAGTVSMVTPKTGVANIDHYIETRASQQRRRGGEPNQTLIVYDPRLHEVATLWLFDRRFIYDSIPTAYADDFTQILADRGNSYFSGYNIYFVGITPYTIWRREIIADTKALGLEQSLQTQGIAPEVIYNRSGVPMFNIYKFSL